MNGPEKVHVKKQDLPNNQDIMFPWDEIRLKFFL